MSFAKLDSGIVNSTLWVLPDDVLRVWVWLLSQADANGVVRVAAPALAMWCMKPVDRIREIMLLLESPDPDSRSEVEDGRRLKRIPGGWQIINYRAYRERVAAEEKRENDRARIAEKRASARVQSSDVAGCSDMSQPVADVAQAEAEAEAENQEPTDPDGSVVPGKPGTPPCPHQKIIDLYHETLPSLARVREWTDARQAFLRKRWAEKPERQTLDWWRKFFAYVDKSDWLMGRKPGRDGDAFECDLEWLVRPRNFVKVIEGKYENRGQA